TLTAGTIKIGTKYHLIVSFHPDCRLKAARAFQVLSTLDSVSKIIFSDPSKSKIEDGAVFSDLNIIIITQEDETSIQEHVVQVDEVLKVQIERIYDTADESADRKVVSTIQTVRVQLSQLDQMMNLLGELIIERNALVQQLHLSGSQLRLFNAMDRAIEDLRRLILRMRLVPLEYLFDHFPRLVREATKGTNKNVKLITSGKHIEVDRTSIDLLNEALIHLVRNAVDHGIEPMKLRKESGKDEQGLIQIIAKKNRNDVVITVEDNGQGIDIQAIRDRAIKEGYINKHSRIDRDGIIALLFLSGFSTSKQITQLSGRGIGLSIAYTNIVEKLNGFINVETQKDVGTRFILRIPASLSIVHALVIKIEDALFTLPLDNVSRIYRITDEKIIYHNQRPFIVINKKAISVISIKKAYGLINYPTTAKEKADKSKEKIIVLWEQGNKQIGILVDSILGQQKIVFKQTDRLMSKIPGYAGFTQIGEGTIVPILDPTKLGR
ncbi:MAG: ATP-binding protein, partial [Promethearchaeota archaeon]